MPEEQLYKVTDALETMSAETGRSIPQVAIAWLLARPSISGVIIGARNEAQLGDNLKAMEFKLTENQIEMLDKASDVRPIYPYWHQRSVSGRAIRRRSDDAHAQSGATRSFSALARISASNAVDLRMRRSRCIAVSSHEHTTSPFSALCMSC